MSSIKLISAKPEEFVINFHGEFERGRGYESNVKFTEECGKWLAEVVICNMPPQESAEDAADRLSKYLLVMSKAVKAKNIKHLNLSKMFSSISK
tara:strand:+ start:55 stop:336 length:282 start_codon:yes stop_codon:yes gene_type:complete